MYTKQQNIQTNQHGKNAGTHKNIYAEGPDT